MLNFAGSSPVVAPPETDSRELVAAELRCLIARIDSSMRLIDAAMEREDADSSVGSVDVVVLDDVTPRYVTASATLNICRADLGRALQQLSEFSKSA